MCTWMPGEDMQVAIIGRCWGWRTLCRGDRTLLSKGQSVVAAHLGTNRLGRNPGQRLAPRRRVPSAGHPARETESDHGRGASLVSGHLPYAQGARTLSRDRSRPLRESTKQKRVTRLQRQMEDLGFMVTLQPVEPAVG